MFLYHLIVGTFVASASLTAVIVISRWFDRSMSGRMVSDLGAVQAAHCRPTPRIGGLGVVLVFCHALLVVEATYPAGPLQPFLWSIVPVFVAGIFEDLGYFIRPRIRLLAAACSACLVIVMTGSWITQSGLMGLDTLLTFTLFSIPFTVLWSAGLCNSFNLIDGVNGLMASIAILIAAAIAYIALSVGDDLILMAALALGAALCGFLVFNFPNGKIFMGDAGAYTVGHLLAWLGIFLAQRNDGVSGISIALLFFWPVSDTLLAIVRRKVQGKPHDQPDRLHVHQLVMRNLEIFVVGRDKRYVANPLTTMIILPFAAAPVVAGILFINQPLTAFLCMLVFTALFVTFYYLGLNCIRRRRLVPLRKLFLQIRHAAE